MGADWDKEFGRLAGAVVGGGEAALGRVEEFAKPGFGEAGLAADGFRGYAEGFRRLLGAESAEVAKFDYLGAAGVKGGEAVKGVVEFEEFGGGGDRSDLQIVNGRGGGAGAAALGKEAARAVDEDLPHGAGGDGEEVGAILDVGVSLAGEAEVEIVDECGTACRVGGVGGEGMGEAAQVVVDDGDEVVEGRDISVAPNG